MLLSLALVMQLDLGVKSRFSSDVILLLSMNLCTGFDCSGCVFSKFMCSAQKKELKLKQKEEERKRKEEEKAKQVSTFLCFLLIRNILGKRL